MAAGPGSSRCLDVWPGADSRSRGDARRLSDAPERGNQERPAASDGTFHLQERKNCVHMPSRHRTRSSAHTLDRLPSCGSALGFCGRAGRYNGPLGSNGSLRIREPADTGPSGSGQSHLFTGFPPQRLDGRPGRGPADRAGYGRFLRGSARTRPRITCPLGAARLHASTAGQRTSTVKYCSQTR